VYLERIYVCIIWLTYMLQIVLVKKRGLSNIVIYISWTYKCIFQMSFIICDLLIKNYQLSVDCEQSQHFVVNSLQMPCNQVSKCKNIILQLFSLCIYLTVGTICLKIFTVTSINITCDSTSYFSGYPSLIKSIFLLFIVTNGICDRWCVIITASDYTFLINNTDNTDLDPENNLYTSADILLPY